MEGDQESGESSFLRAKIESLVDFYGKNRLKIIEDQGDYRFILNFNLFEDEIDFLTAEFMIPGEIFYFFFQEKIEYFS